MDMLNGGCIVGQETKLKYQICIFGDFSKYGATEENLRKCFEGFFKFQMLPNQIQEFNPGVGETQNRISLQSIATGIAVNILSDRMDIVAVPLPGSPASKITMDQFVQAAMPVAEELIKIFPATVNRVGVVQESFLSPLPVDQLDVVRAKFLGEKLPFAQGLPTNEWNIRDVVLAEVAGIPSNHIYALARVKAQIGDNRGVQEQESHHLMLDINTSPVHGAMLRDFSIVRAFVEQALVAMNKIRADVVGRIYG
ncbi:hypothetical protein [Pseudomonas hunanensis]|uniref:hypothetical protein n=1 Tax=Pseudomonas hunanensis TaxID=1247546 RepID=UPI0030DBFB9C